MFDILVIIVFFVVVLFWTESWLITAAGTAILIGVFDLSVDIDAAREDFNKLTEGKEIVITHDTGPATQELQLTELNVKKSSFPSEYVDNRIRDKWIAVNLWAEKDGRKRTFACYVDNEPGTNCFIPRKIVRHTDGDLYACQAEDKCNIVRQ